MPWVTAVDTARKVASSEGFGQLERVKKYITRVGFERLREEFRRLVYEERPRVTREVTIAAAHGDRSENYEYKLGKKKLREIDARIHRLQKQLEAYEVVDPATRPKVDRVFFGATVTVEDDDGAVVTYQIVGGDELDESLGQGRISYEAPLGRALLGKREGESVTVRRPAGEIELTVVKVEWK
jgi:transcription elongation factor GreB